MFKKSITRDIQGVVIAGQGEKTNIATELEEYVVTPELQRHFADFFSAYAKGINGETTKMGVWISGFFGSGKSHLLKILSYILDNEVVGGKRAIDYFIDDKKISDQMVLADMQLAANTPSDIIIFNIDAKSESDGKSNKDAIVNVFLKVFNNSLGFCGAIPYLADLERKLTEDGKYEEFKETYQRVTGHNWYDERHEFLSRQDGVVDTLIEMGYMSEKAAWNWCDAAIGDYQISIEDFAKRVKSYIDRKGNNIRPHVSVVMNLTKPTKDKPALLTLGEVETFLHEFGHSLHGMFANTRFESLSGTNVWWDFVELPSQFMENYSVEKEFLRTFAFHYETGEPLPDELIERIVRSRNFMAAYGCMRQVSFGLLDMAYYTKRDEFAGDIVEFEKEAWKRAVVLEQSKDTCMTVQFSHIMAGGYAAGYYSYKWAEVLDADAFSVFKKKGIFDRDTAQRFRENILSKGGTEHPMVLYRKFRGSEPTIDALLKRNGIKRR